jgi:YfiH family protein
MTLSAPTLEILTSDLLAGARHGFFTRRGGASSGVYRGLNCGCGSHDQAEAVQLNRARVAAAIGVAPERLLSLHQVHSARVIVAGPEGWHERPRADAAVTDQPGVALSVLTADCAPVLLHDPAAGVVGAAHAGWRGAFTGVIEATIAAMERCGAARSNIVAAAGPMIRQHNYEVGPEFVARFIAHSADNNRFFSPSTKPGHAMFDLAGYIAARLLAAGIRHREDIGLCTYADEDSFYSYRRSVHRNESDYGRHINAIALSD